MGNGSVAVKSDEVILGSARTFVHEPLNLGQHTIRVLQILPGRSSETIKCILNHVPRQRDGYVCLSYMWGAEYPNHVITVNGMRFSVRQKLFRFLELARKLEMKDRLWIDAICIDQDNVLERNHQVQQMAEIYRHAKHVLVYPGDISWRMHLAIWLLVHKPSPNGVRSSENRGAYKIGRLLCLSRKLSIEYPRPLPIGRLPYWERTWIVQEILLAQKIFVVSDAGLLPWNAFSAFYMRSAMIEQDQVNELPYLQSLCEWRKSDKPSLRFDLLVLLNTFSDTQCADVRDRVYGLLGLANDGKNSWSTIDDLQPCYFWMYLNTTFDDEWLPPQPSSA